MIFLMTFIIKISVTSLHFYGVSDGLQSVMYYAIYISQYFWLTQVN